MTEKPWTRDPRDREPSDPADTVLPGPAAGRDAEGRPLIMCRHGHVNQQGDLCPICDADELERGGTR